VNEETFEVQGDSKFFIDMKTVPLSATVDIQAAISIPKLKSFGYVDIEVNSTAASFEGELSLFGGIFNPFAKVAWYWDFSYFYMRLEHITLANGLVLLNQVTLDVAPTQLKVDFNCVLTVLFFVELQASFSIDIATPIKLDFNRELVIGDKTSSITVNAVLDTENIKNTEIETFNLDVANGFFVSVPEIKILASKNIATLF
jgi:hypothetical protein